MENIYGYPEEYGLVRFWKVNIEREVDTDLGGEVIAAWTNQKGEVWIALKGEKEMKFTGHAGWWEVKTPHGYLLGEVRYVDSPTPSIRSGWLAVQPNQVDHAYPTGPIFPTRMEAGRYLAGWLG